MAEIFYMKVSFFPKQVTFKISKKMEKKFRVLKFQPSTSTSLSTTETLLNNQPPNRMVTPEKRGEIIQDNFDTYKEAQAFMDKLSYNFDWKYKIEEYLPQL